MKYILTATGINNLNHPEAEGMKITKVIEEYVLDTIEEVKEYEEAIISGIKFRGTFGGFSDRMDIKVNENNEYEVYIDDEIFMTLNITYKEA